VDVMSSFLSLVLKEDLEQYDQYEPLQEVPTIVKTILAGTLEA